MAERTHDELRLAEGTQLLGEYQGSGMMDAPYLVRRRDGHNVQVSRLVYLVAEALTTYSHPEAVADAVTRRFGREVSAANILYLVENKLAPVGLVADDTAAELPVAANPILALRLRLPLVPERAHRLVTTALKPLFWPPFILAALAGLVVVDVWLLTSLSEQVAEGTRMIFYEPKLLLLVTLMSLVAGVFHEMGHAAACRYGGATPGAMGAGVYLVWPVFYTDVSDTYRLDRRGRLRTDLGGVYFNVLLTLVAVWLFTTTGYAPMLVMAIMLQLETLRQFLPFVRLDGYYVMSDLAGVPNLFAYMGPVLTLLARRGSPEVRQAARRKLQELTRRARILIVGWVVVTVPVLAGNVILFLFLLPRMAGAAWGSAAFQIDGMTTAAGDVTPVGVANGVTSLLLLALPVAGMSYLLTMLLTRGARLASRTLPHRPALTSVVTAAVALVLVAQVGTFWPDTFTAALHRVQEAPAGSRPALPEAFTDLPAGLSAFTHRSPVASPVQLDVAADGPEPDTADLAVAGPTTTPEPTAPEGHDEQAAPGASPDPTSQGGTSPEPGQRADRGQAAEPSRPRGPEPTAPVTSAPPATEPPPDERPPPTEQQRPLERLEGALDELFE